ncbi:MAG TPA: serine/threonine-protein kinase [Gemmatales bacterium]|nr:serine/threonine-protein kinase [Gemmatales bacterium]
MSLVEAKRLARLAIERYGLEPAAVQALLAHWWPAHGDATPDDLLAEFVAAGLLTPDQPARLGAEFRDTQILIPTSDAGSGSASRLRRERGKLVLPPSIHGHDLLRKLGEGGMGEVHLVREPPSDRLLAMKILSPAMAEDHTLLSRFQREAAHSVKLEHPNIVRGFGGGFDPEAGVHFLLLEHVDGPSVQNLLEHLGRFSLGDSVRIALDMARALEHAHAHGIIHRDLKPENILLTAAGVAKLTDLGLSKELNSSSSLTQARRGFGTPHYMPYEQAADARAADARSDLYALGATLYHMATGVVPFDGESALDILEKKALGIFTPPRSHNPEIPEELEDLICRLLAREPDDRPQTASEVIVELERMSLASPVLSFVDRREALTDPTIRRRMASSQQVTQPDVTLATRWYLEFNDSRGRTRRVQATAAHIVRSLQRNKLPASARACRDAQGPYRRLDETPEFIPHVQRRRPPTPMPGAIVAPAPPAVAKNWTAPWWLWVAGSALVFILILLVLLWLT